MGSTSRGLLGTLKSWLSSPCSDNKDHGSEFCGSGACGSYRMDDSLLREDVLKRSGPEKYYQVYYDQPRPTSPIRATPPRSVSRGRLQKDNRRSVKKQSDMGWMDKNFSSGKRTTRRPQISTPFNFQHTGSGAVDFMRSLPDLPRSIRDEPRSAPPFRRLELSIYEPSNRVSPLLPYFADDDVSVSPPPPAQIRDFFDDDSTTLAHSRSYSSLSFHIPRRPVGDGASFMTISNFGDSPPRIPPRARTRPRAYTSPSVEAIVERIASALIEREILQEEIESIMERQSICLSRPSTAYGAPDAPMPDFSVLPPTAPSFAERLSIDRPRTAPSTKTSFYPPPLPPPPPAPLTVRAQSLDVPGRQTGQTEQTPTTPSKQQAVQASAFNSHPPYTSPKIIDNTLDMSVPLAPPLPLILRPPLRKKKSFSRVSSWLFPTSAGQETVGESSSSFSQARGHKRDISLDSVTNSPRALTDKDGFYQTLPPSAIFSGRRSSFDSMSDVVSRVHTGSVYSTDEEHPGVGTTTATSTHWSPANTPPEVARRQLESLSGNGHETKLSLGRTGTFGSETSSSSPVEEGLQVKVQGPRPTSVGVAF